MKIRKAHCLFEQSGTFKNEFKKLGIPAEDYDILNQFGETDHVIDLYKEIDSEYKRERERERRFSARSRNKTYCSPSSLASGLVNKSSWLSMGSKGKTRTRRMKRNWNVA